MAVPYDSIAFSADQKGTLKLEEVKDSPALFAIVKLAGQLTTFAKFQ